MQSVATEQALLRQITSAKCTFVQMHLFSECHFHTIIPVLAQMELPEAASSCFAMQRIIYKHPNSTGIFQK